MKKLYLILTLFFVTSSCFAMPSVNLQFKVVDQNGLPVEGATIGGSFYDKNRVPKSMTDSDGIGNLKGDTPGLIRYGVSKEGYYGTSGEYANFIKYNGILGFRRWEPYDPTIDVILKKIKNPIALYATIIFGIKLPRLDEFVGFDLLKRDWVLPNGLGLKSDILFKFEKKRANSSRDYHVVFTVAFPNELDGIHKVVSNRQYGSRLKLPYHAPTSNYDNKLVMDMEKILGKTYDATRHYKKKNNHYFFRVRSKVNETGELESTLYGKTFGPFEIRKFIKEPTVTISFQYYINPKINDTNLEFDNKQNLFPDRSRNERANHP